MAEVDISKDIYKAIENDFKAGVRADAGIQKLAKKISGGKGSQKDMAALADRFGLQASKAFKRNIKLSELPNETLYWNIAEKTIQPLLLTAYENINAHAAVQQRFADKAARINIALLKGDNPENRVRAVMQMAVDSLTQPELDNALTDPVISTARKFYDDFQKVNSALRTGMGFREFVVREYDGVGLHNGRDRCEWCIERAGTWDYSEASANGVFERHPGCGCTIAHYTERGVNIKNIKVG